jgi:hypothetical protein
VIATTTFEDPKIVDMHKVAVQISCCPSSTRPSNQEERAAGLAATPPPTADKEVSLQPTEGIVTRLLAKICCTCSRLDVARLGSADRWPGESAY